MLIIQQDYRLGNIPRAFVTDNEKDINMQIPDEIRKCVVFLGHSNKDKTEIVLKGTGFFVGIDYPNKDRTFVYLVTARHIIANIKERKLAVDNNIFIRINKKDGGFDFIAVPINMFIPHPDPVDVMILPLAPDIGIYDYLTLPYHMLLTQDIIEKQNVSLGDDVFMTGLFVRHTGKEKNIPIVRAGNIAAMPEEQVYNKFFGNMDAYLVELRSLGGLSGSPVFVNLSGNRIMKPNKDNGITTTMSSGHRFYLLGLLHGHWDLDSAIQDVITEDYQQEKKEKINTGIGITIPSIQISETLNQPIVRNIREQTIKSINNKNAPTEDTSNVPQEFDRLIEKAIEYSPKED